MIAMVHSLTWLMLPGAELTSASNMVWIESIITRSGSKRSAAAGNHAFTVANPKKDLAWNRKWISHLREHPLTGDILPKLGSPAIVGGMQDKKLLGSGESEGCAVGEGGVTNVGCIGCPVKCERAVPVSGGIVRNPEYKALSRLSGSNDTILKWNRELDELGLRVEVDHRNEKLGYKIREAQLQRIPYMLVVGDRDVESGVVSVRSRKGGDLGAMTLDAFKEKILEEVKTRARD